ncbi:MAG: alpha-amylase family glycosyl hydrolase, partial [Planctomycetota bacterium]|nr:alpha-amylase family glycosyl hydrolase [Planctomycetota bacterium]
MPPLTSTYRIQFGPDFTFADARAIVPHLAALGVSHLYASPILAAHPGAAHGYSVIDPTRLDPRLGTRADFDALVDALHAHDMGLILDIVPNHMAADTSNPWWRDVLTHGAASRFAHVFDIDWTAGPPARQGRIVLPILGSPLVETLRSGDAALTLGADGAFAIRFPGHELPVDPKSLEALLTVGDAPRSLEPALEAIRAMPNRLDARDHAEERAAATDRFHAALGLALATAEAATAWLDRQIERLNALLAEAAPAALAFLDSQPWIAMHWREGLAKINYRRFFDIADLVCLRMEDERVFDLTHALIGELVRSGAVDGLRIDHIDGLADPAAYLRRLKSTLSPDRPAL